MKAVIYFALSKKHNGRNFADTIDGDHYEILNLDKVKKTYFLNMFVYGYKSYAKKEVHFESPVIDFDKYDEIVLISPVWAGKICIYMKQYLQENRFKNKTVSIIATSMGENKNYFKTYDGILDESNKVIEHLMYAKGKKIYERKM